MGTLQNKTALVTGGSRGIGRGIVEALAAEGATVITLARDAERLESLKQAVAGVQTRVADITHPQTAAQIMQEVRPDILVLNAGATPTMLPVHQHSWESFSSAWDTDVKAAFHFGKEAILLPMAPGSTVIVLSSGAALTGSPLSGGYAGAKRTQWLLTEYLQGESNELDLGIRFIALLPRQLVGTTQIGQAALTAYSAKFGITQAAYLDRQGTHLTAEFIGQGVVTLLTDPAYHAGVAFGINSQGLASLNGA